MVAFGDQCRIALASSTRPHAITRAPSTMRATTSEMAVPSSPPRLNSSSAASAVQRLATQMTAAISEAGTVATLRPLISDLAGLGVALTSDTFVVDVAIGADVSVEQANAALAWLTGAADARIDSLDELPREWHSSPAPRRS